MARPVDPRAIEAIFQRGLKAAADGGHDEAGASFQQVLRLAPHHVGALVSLGSAELRRGRAYEAEQLYRQALEIAPGQPIAFRNLAVLLNDAERHEEAMTLAEAALAADPASTPARLARANALAGLGRPEAAVAELRQAEAAQPASAEIKAKIGLLLAELGRDQAAIEAMDSAIAIDPDDALTRFRRGIVRLRLRRFAEGWDDYEQRLKLAVRDVHAAGLIAPGLAPQLSEIGGLADIAGQRVLLVAEQGIGDQVMFASVLPDLIATAAAVTCVCDARLVRLFSHSFPTARFLAPGGGAVARSSIDKVLALGSLGRLFRRSVEDFPRQAYLRPRPEVAERWKARLGLRPRGLRIGLSWRGGTTVTRAGVRSVPLEKLEPVLALPGCEFVSLQFGDPRAELAAAASALPAPIRVFAPEEIADFEELAGLVANLDVVVSVQTSLVHLCGATGAECLTLMARYPEWRYGAAGETMPWYGSVRLFRQGDDQAWPPVVERVAAELSRRLG